MNRIEYLNALVLRAYATAYFLDPISGLPNKTLQFDICLTNYLFFATVTTSGSEKGRAEQGAHTPGPRFPPYPHAPPHTHFLSMRNALHGGGVHAPLLSPDFTHLSSPATLPQKQLVSTVLQPLAS